MIFTIYFEAWGRKLKTTIEADSKYGALEELRDQIEIIKVVSSGKPKSTSDEGLEMLKNMFGMK